MPEVHHPQPYFCFEMVCLTITSTTSNVVIRDIFTTAVV